MSEMRKRDVTRLFLLIKHDTVKSITVWHCASTVLLLFTNTSHIRRPQSLPEVRQPVMCQFLFAAKAHPTSTEPRSSSQWRPWSKEDDTRERPAKDFKAANMVASGTRASSQADAQADDMTGRRKKGALIAVPEDQTDRPSNRAMLKTNSSHQRVQQQRQQAHDSRCSRLIVATASAALTHSLT